MNNNDLNYFTNLIRRDIEDRKRKRKWFIGIAIYITILLYVSNINNTDKESVVMQYQHIQDNLINKDNDTNKMNFIKDYMKNVYGNELFIGDILISPNHPRSTKELKTIFYKAKEEAEHMYEVKIKKNKYVSSK